MNLIGKRLLNTLKRNPWLDVVRATAIFLVLIGHGRVFLESLGEWTTYLGIASLFGVEIFFVLSGFLIGTIIIQSIKESENNGGWIFSFWIRRWFRTVPNYFLFIFLNLVLLIIGIRQSEVPSLVQYVFFIQNLIAPHPGFFPEAWSLAVEELFYFFVPLLILFFGFWSKNHSKIVLSVTSFVFLSCFLLRLVWVAKFDPSFDLEVRKISLFRLDAIMTGVFMAWIGSLNISLTKWQNILAKTILIVCFIASLLFLLINKDTLDESFFARTGLFVFISVGCLGYVLLGMKWHVPFMIDKVTSSLARWSYSAYLFNLPLLEIIRKYINLPGLLSWLLFITLTFVFSFLNYRYFELYFLSFRDRLTKHG